MLLLQKDVSAFSKLQSPITLKLTTPNFSTFYVSSFHSNSNLVREAVWSGPAIQGGFNDEKNTKGPAWLDYKYEVKYSLNIEYSMNDQWILIGIFTKYARNIPLNTFKFNNIQISKLRFWIFQKISSRLPGLVASGSMPWETWCLKDVIWPRWKWWKHSNDQILGFYSERGWRCCMEIWEKMLLQVKQEKVKWSWTWSLNEILKCTNPWK